MAKIFQSFSSSFKWIYYDQIVNILAWPYLWYYEISIPEISVYQSSFIMRKIDTQG